MNASGKAFAFLVSLSLFASLIFSGLSANTAIAAEKTDTVTGTITLAIEADAPVPDPTPDAPGDNPIVDPTTPVSDGDVAQTPDTIQDLLAKTGDALPIVALALVLACVAGTYFMIASRRKATNAGISVESASKFSNVQKIAIIALAFLLIAGTGLAFNKAIADDNADSPASTTDTSTATAIGKITVSEGGIVKSAEINLKNNLKTDLKLSKFSVSSDSEIADLVNDQVAAGETLASGDIVDKTWTPAESSISAELLEKLNAEESKSLSYDLIIDVAYNTVKVEFAVNDGTDAIFETQEIAEGGNATLPATEPSRENYEFKSWTTSNGDPVDAAYLAANALSADTKFFAKWSGPEVFLAATSSDKELPCKIFGGEDTTTEIKTIDEAKAAATTLKDGGTVDTSIYNATTDAWHLFAKISGDGSNANDWLECRIIQTGQHDGDGTGLTFQAIHALPNKVAYDSTYTDTSTSYTGNWKSSTLRTYLNGSFKSTLPTALQSALKTGGVAKRTNKVAGENPVAGKEAVETTDDLWILSFTELVKNGGTKSTYWGTGSDDHDGSTYNFWAEKDLVIGQTPAAGEPQAKLLLALNSDRSGNIIPYDEGQTLGYSWQRSVSPDSSTSVLSFYSSGYVGYYIGGYPFRERCVAPSFAL